MFDRKKIAALSVLVGGLVVAGAGVTQAYAGADPGACTQDVLGNLSCTQRFKGEVPEGEIPPHQDTCQTVQPLTVPAVLGNGRARLGPEVTCSPETWGSTGTREDRHAGHWRATTRRADDAT
ncbi:hypothetical protein ACGFZQ_06820 [Streptomyces sp. NPDC048254]|uniref:hypothetical protein n=1 Tax=Streptomyces sp. NPDC048254 TaxID=3365525 RepID=UPI003723105E